MTSLAPKAYVFGLTAAEIEQRLNSLDNFIQKDVIRQSLSSPSADTIPSTQAVTDALTPIQDQLESLGNLAGNDSVSLDSEETTGVLPVTKGGTGGNTVELARQNLGILTQDEIQTLIDDSVSELGSVDLSSPQVTNVLPMVKGGTGANTPSQARANLGVWSSSQSEKLKQGTVESIRRSYAEIGFVLVDGSFETGGVLVNPNEVLLSEQDWKGYSGPAGVIPAGTDPLSGPFQDMSTQVISRKFLVFNTVEDMKSMQIRGTEVEDTLEGLLVRTVSYHGGWASLIDPVGGATYVITKLESVREVRGASWVPDGFVDHFLSLGDGSTYVATILVKDTISIEQSGAIPNDTSFDNYGPIQAALNWANTMYGYARQITAGVGSFYFSKTLLIDSLQPNYGLCTGIIGAGWARTYLVKTTNTPADGSQDYSVDAYIAYKTRSPSQNLYSYSSQLKHLTCKSTAPNKHSYGVYGKLVSHMDWEEFEVQSALIGVYSFDAWLIRWGGVRASLCDLGFKIAGTGTTLGWKNVWAHNCKNGGYDITGVVYAEWSNCAADHIFDVDNPSVNKVAYRFENCQGIHLSGCGTENVSEVITMINSIIECTAFRVNSIRAGASGQTLIRATNNSGGAFSSSGFTSVPATSNIAVQSKDSTSQLSFSNCAFQIANSAVPNDSAHRRNGLTSSMPLDVMGLKTVKTVMNGVTWRPISALKSGCGFMILSGVADSADRYVVLSKPFWAYTEISSNPSSPTTIGYLADASGVSQTSLRASRVVDSYGVEMLQFNFSGSISVTLQFVVHTAQHW